MSRLILVVILPGEYLFVGACGGDDGACCGDAGYYVVDVQNDKFQ